MRPLTASMYARLNVERTHTRKTRGSRCLNNAHVLYRKCLFIVRNKYSYRSGWKLHTLPPPVLSCALAYHHRVFFITTHTSTVNYFTRLSKAAKFSSQISLPSTHDCERSEPPSHANAACRLYIIGASVSEPPLVDST